jgi:glyoxylase-like metal-dependent hydrolase (beta-lactamase superfamily II)
VNVTVHTATADAETFTCNAFLATGAVTALVDAGAYDGVVDAVREHVDGVDALFLTHQHGDHVAALDAVVDAFDPNVYAYSDHEHRTHALSDGDTVDIGDGTFDVVHTPGHASDHLSFVSDTTLYSGDVVVHDDGAFTDGSFGRTDYAGQSRDRLVESIHDLLDRLPDSVEHMYSGHGDEYHGDVRAIVETARERAERHEPKYPDE